jgi:hypothetical protein
LWCISVVGEQGVYIGTLEQHFLAAVAGT